MPTCFNIYYSSIQRILFENEFYFIYLFYLFNIYLFNIYTGLPAQAKPVLPQGPVDIHTMNVFITAKNGAAVNTYLLPFYY